MCLFGVLIGTLLGLGLGAWGRAAAYRNGLTDGYGFSREPRNPGYRAAGLYLCRRMHHRWPELRRWPNS